MDMNARYGVGKILQNPGLNVFKMDLKVVRAVQAIQSSNYSLDSVRRLQETGFDFTLLSGEIICGIVARNFGLGLKILLSCGIKLDCVDRTTGNSPIILLAAEGLCGPVRNLLADLPVEHLQHTNVDQKSVLSLLLARGHGACGCLESLLLRLHSSPHRLISPTHPGNRVILSAGDLLQRIRTPAVDRIDSVVKLWISFNFIDLDVETGEIQKNVNALFLQQTVEKVVKDCLTGWISARSIALSTSKCLQLLCKLLILGCLDAEFLEDCLEAVDNAFSNDGPKPLEQHQMKQLERIEYGLEKLKKLFTPVPPLTLQSVLAIRRYLQRSMKLVLGNSESIVGCLNEFLFHRQLEKLDLPRHLHNLVLLKDDFCLC